MTFPIGNTKQSESKSKNTEILLFYFYLNKLEWHCLKCFAKISILPKDFLDSATWRFSFMNCIDMSSFVLYCSKVFQAEFTLKYFCFYCVRWQNMTVEFLFSFEPWLTKVTLERLHKLASILSVDRGLQMCFMDMSGQIVGSRKWLFT